MGLNSAYKSCTLEVLFPFEVIEGDNRSTIVASNLDLNGNKSLYFEEYSMMIG
jgi:hypothetical protein